MKTRAKIAIIVVENREPNYFIIIFKCKQVPLSFFSYQMLASTFDYHELSSYYKVYAHLPCSHNLPKTCHTTRILSSMQDKHHHMPFSSFCTYVSAPFIPNIKQDLIAIRCSQCISMTMRYNSTLHNTALPG